MSAPTATVVFISGFLTPPAWISCHPDFIPPHMNLICVYPSPVGSLHDRACQVFYELMGGVVDYGEDHSTFHSHARYGRHFPGKHRVWSAEHPVYIVGHSFGGVTAWVLHNYLAQTNRFSGHNTSAAWVKGLLCVNTPFSGALQVYQKGLDIHQPPLIHWGTEGYIISVIAHISEYLNLAWTKRLWDADQGKTS